jgi:hypothetical protein
MLPDEYVRSRIALKNGSSFLRSRGLPSLQFVRGALPTVAS